MLIHKQDIRLNGYELSQGCLYFKRRVSLTDYITKPIYEAAIAEWQGIA